LGEFNDSNIIKNKTLVENSDKDSFWGCGFDKKSENNMGKIWMKIRQEIIASL